VAALAAPLVASCGSHPRPIAGTDAGPPTGAGGVIGTGTGTGTGDGGGPWTGGGASGTAGDTGAGGSGVAGPTLVVGAGAEAMVACMPDLWSRPALDGGGVADAGGAGSADDGGSDLDAAGDGGPGSIPAPDWSLRFGGPYQDQAQAVAAGDDGSVFLASVQLDSVDFGEGTVGSPSCGQYISAFGPSGAHRWSRGTPYVGAVAATPDGGALATVLNAAVASLAPDGSVRWVRTRPYATSAQVLVAGDAIAVATVGFATVSDVPIWIDRLTPAGDTTWTFSFFAPYGNPYVALSRTGEVFMALRFYDQVTIGNQSFLSNGAADIVVAKLDAAGGLAWARQLGTTSDDLALGIVATPDGGAVLLAEAPATLDLGAGPIGAGSSDVGFLAQLDGRGAITGGRAWTTSTQGAAAGWLRQGPSGKLVFGLDFADPIDVAGTTVHTGASGDVDFLVVEVTPSFTVDQFWHFGNGGGAQHLGGLDVDPTGALILAGSFEGKLDLGSGTLRSAGSFDTFVAKVQP
jgi:hypothetical protein